MKTTPIDELGAVTAMRQKMQLLETLAEQYDEIRAAQINLTCSRILGREVALTALQEQQNPLIEEYARVRRYIILLQYRHDLFCERRGVAYSPSWEALLDELGPYKAGIGFFSIWWAGRAHRSAELNP